MALGTRDSALSGATATFGGGAATPPVRVSEMVALEDGRMMLSLKSRRSLCTAASVAFVVDERRPGAMTTTTRDESASPSRTRTSSESLTRNSWSLDRGTLAGAGGGTADASGVEAGAAMAPRPATTTRTSATSVTSVRIDTEREEAAATAFILSASDQQRKQTGTRAGDERRARYWLRGRALLPAGRRRRRRAGAGEGRAGGEHPGQGG